MINRKKAATLICFPIFIMLTGVIITVVIGDHQAAGMAGLATGVIYAISLPFQEKYVRREQVGLSICMLLLGGLYIYA